MRAREQPASFPVVQRPDRRGRPTILTPVLVDRVCQLTRERHSLREVAKVEGMPSTATIKRWLATEVEGEEGVPFEVFRARLTRAREARADLRLEELADIKRRLIGKGVPKADRLDAQTARAAAEITRVQMELEAPKKYGKAVTLKGDPKSPITVTRYELTDEQLAAIAAADST